MYDSFVTYQFSNTTYWLVNEVIKVKKRGKRKIARKKRSKRSCVTRFDNETSIKFQFKKKKRKSQKKGMYDLRFVMSTKIVTCQFPSVISW